LDVNEAIMSIQLELYIANSIAQEASLDKGPPKADYLESMMPQKSQMGLFLHGIHQGKEDQF
jgi:hypothetical protein